MSDAAAAPHVKIIMRQQNNKEKVLKVDIAVWYTFLRKKYKKSRNTYFR
jgi:hypothetical protein